MYLFSVFMMWLPGEEMNGGRVAAVGLAAVQRPAVVKPEAYAANPHRRKEKPMVPRYLGDHHYRRHGNPYGAREKASHAYESERGGVDLERCGKDVRKEEPDCRAQSSAADERRREHAARAARTDREGSRHRLREEDSKHQEADGLSVQMLLRQRLADDRIARAEDLRNETSDETSDKSA